MNEYGVHEAQYAALVADLEAAGLGVGAPVTELRLVRAAGSGVEI